MKNIEIATAHNIVFKYELASVMYRSLAFIIDLLILIAYSSLASVIFGWSTFLNYTFVFLAIAFYHLLCEVFNRGQSIGKKILKLRVVTLRGTTPTVNDYLVRWVFRLVDITFSIGTLAIINISGSSKNQRIGDLIAQTSVVHLRNSQKMSLKGLEVLNESEEEIKYPGLARYTDEDMLLLKHALHRYINHKTDENKKILTDIGERIISDLEIKDKNEFTIDFLKELLNEYVLITRK